VEANSSINGNDGAMALFIYRAVENRYHERHDKATAIDSQDDDHAPCCASLDSSVTVTNCL